MGQTTTVSGALKRIILALVVAALMAAASAGPATAGTWYKPEPGEPGLSGDVGYSSDKNSTKSSGSRLHHKDLGGTCAYHSGGKKSGDETHCH